MKIWALLMIIYASLVWVFEPAWNAKALLATERPLIEVIDCKEVTCPNYVEKDLKTQQKTIKARVFGYTSLVELTDSSPFITASGERVYAGGIANNCQKFGTKIQIGGQTLTVNDRMHERYKCSDFDIWFPTLKEAKEWGVKKVNVIIL